MKINQDLAALHGYLCGDGYVTRNSKHQKHVYYHTALRNTNLVLLKDFQSRFYNYFKIKPIIYKNERAIVYSKEIYHKLVNEFGSFYSREWKIPKFNKINLRNWLRAFYDCEGWVELQKAKSRVIGLQSINKSGIRAVQRGLSNFNINSSLKYKNNRDIWDLRICGLDDLKRFAKYINFYTQIKTKN